LTKIILKKTTSALFLAIVLVIGTFAAISPSFITGVNAQSESYYGMDKDRKSDKKDVSVQSLKCNNINVNVNGLELSVLPPFLGGEVAAEAQDANTDANSNPGNGDGFQINDFRFICINNNNNVVLEEESPIPPVDECAEDVEACFAENLSGDDFATLTAALENGLDVVIEGEPVTLNSFADICSALGGLAFLDLLTAVAVILSAAEISLGSDVIQTIAECIEPSLAL
jgi:hypothetical protein